MPLGILAGLVTCALWGLTFVAPRAVAPFTTWDLTVARYLVFGAMSAALMLHPRLRPRGLGPRRLVTGLLLGWVGYVAYFVAAAFAVRSAGAAIPPVVIGTMPVVLPVIANLRERALPWRRLALPLAAIAAGVALVDAAALAQAPPENREAVWLGTAFAGLALVIWIAYGLVNAAVMRAPDAPDGLRWTGIQGLGAALGCLPLLPLVSFGDGAPVSEREWQVFAAWALLMGVVGSWFATWSWMVAARRLPLALAAQLIVAETVFGLVYGFLFEARWPSAAEAAGCALQLGGVAAATLTFGRAARAAVAVTATPRPEPPAPAPFAAGCGAGRDTGAVR